MGQATSPCLKPPSSKKDLVDRAQWPRDVSAFEVTGGSKVI